MTTPVGVSPSPPAARALSIVVATFNRAELLDRALATYARQTLDRDCWEYLLADDGSQDHTREVVEAWRGRGLPIRLFDAERDLLRPKTPGVWRDGSGLRNALSTFAVGRHLVSTHPEILLPPDALASTLAALDTAPPRSWVTAIPFWLPEAPEAVWGEWRGTRAELDRLRSLPGFWADDWPTPLQAPGAVDYRNQNQARRLDWQSEVFWGMPMALWRYMGGFREFEVWGSVDPDFWARRSVLGIETIPIPAKEGSPHAKGVLMVYHQNHASPRDMDVTHAALRAADAVRPYRSPVDVRATGGLAGNYHHGPRERAAEPGTLTGIMDDHVTRSARRPVWYGLRGGAPAARGGELRRGRHRRGERGGGRPVRRGDHGRLDGLDAAVPGWAGGRRLLLRGARTRRGAGRDTGGVRARAQTGWGAAPEHTTTGGDGWHTMGPAHADPCRTVGAIRPRGVGGGMVPSGQLRLGPGRRGGAAGQRGNPDRECAPTIGVDRCRAMCESTTPSLTE
jgi:hypothetical protein